MIDCLRPWAVVLLAAAIVAACTGDTGSSASQRASRAKSDRPAPVGAERPAVDASTPQAWFSTDGRRITTSDTGPAATKLQALRGVPGEYLVKFRTGTSSAAVAKALSRVALQSMRGYRSIPGLRRVRIATGASAEDTIAAFRSLPEVEYIEPNYIVTAGATPNDPSYSLQWALNNVGQNNGIVDADIDAPEAWNVTTGSSSVVIAVIDTGVEYTHPDLAANVFQNAADCNADGIDDDGDGYADDCHGIDTLNGDSDPMDDNHHGTHVAGTIGAVGNNAVGISGVAWSVRILPCKFLDAGGSGTTADAIACLDYLATLKDRGVNIVASNNSWGGAGRSQALRDAIVAQMQHGILFVAAAGNDGLDLDTDVATYPCALDVPNIICVAATTPTDQLAPFSNYGSSTVHIAAPGESIFSTSLNGGYETLSGTSMATPHVTGTIALLKAQDATRDWRALKNLVLAGSDAIGTSQATITEHRLNAAKALNCSNSVVLARLRPIKRPDFIVAVGDPVELAALHVRCAVPDGNVTVTVNPGGDTVTLLDDGLGGDEVAGDGIYSGHWTPTSGGDFTLGFPETPADTVSITVDAQLKHGFPVDAPSLPGTYLGGQEIHVLVGNIDADPELEIMETSTALGPLLVWKSSGARAAGWWDLPPAGAAYPVLGEFNGDPSSQEVHVNYFEADSVLYSGNAVVQPGWPLPHDSEFAASAADFDGDGIDEIVMSRVWRANGTSFTQPVREYFGPTAIADIDGDGFDDVVYQADNAVIVSDSAGRLARGFPAYDNDSPGYSVHGVPAIGDLDADGKLEIVIVTIDRTPSSNATVQIFSADGSVKGRIPLGSQINYSTEPVLADLDGDGIPEIVVQTNSQAYALKGDGAILAGWPVALGDSWVASFAPVVGDLDGDGAPDIVIETEDPGAPSGVIRVFNRHGAMLPGFPKAIHGFGTGMVPAIADIDLDGRNDLIAGVALSSSGSQHALWVYDLGGPPSHGPIEWGQYREGPKHHAYYELGKNLANDAFVAVHPGLGGSIASADNAIQCGSDCIQRYAKGTHVVLTATPVAGGAFLGWNGDCAGQGNPCNLLVSKYRFAAARFATRTLSVSVTSQGSVSSVPAGIQCPGDCTEDFAPGAVVQLTQTPAQSFYFAGWSGACSGQSPTCSVTMDQAQSVSADFARMPVAIVTHLGQGGGSVTSNPDGINCGADCGEYYSPNTRVTLTATADADSIFSGWSGSCGGTASTCSLIMDSDQFVYATFDQKPGVQVSLNGAGKVTSTPPGIDCGSDCTERYPLGTIVTLSETPTTGSYFLGWGGACTGTDTTCSVSIDGAKWVEANFRQLPSISIARAGTGAGTVTSQPAGIDCGSDCQEYYFPGTVVTLTAAAAVGSDFTGWGGNSNACTGTDPVCMVTALYAHYFVANFVIHRYALNVSTAGTGSGTVASSPTGINCGADCAEDYDYGTVVNLTATAGAGSSFDSWSGACSGSANPCAVTIDAGKSVTATFRTNPPPPSGGGGGSFGAFWLALGSALLALRRRTLLVGS